ncbi:MAG: NUDIX domain-containing protein [Flavobacteriaceae bacterium]|nr:NUDIX domain-containing protein [Flavobacteriaceae bacterium]
MYKVFVNDKPIYLTSEVVFHKEAKCLMLKDVDLETVVKKVAKNKWPQVYLYYPNGEQLIQKLKKKIPVVVAAGGLVRNESNEILFIKRNGKWDLPKGRVEEKETIEEAALRETEEETGVTGLEIVKPLQITYHFFNRNEKLKLKETYWFEMKTSFTGDLAPEKSEGIQKAVWKNPKKTAKALRKSYANIRELFYQEVNLKP